MSLIIIDGYNLIGTHHKDLNSRREELIRLLAAYRKLKDHEITVVFDGWKSGGGREEQITTAGIKIIYSRIGEKADAVIKRIISRDSREWIVITSDNEIVSHAWSCGSVPVPSAEFLNILERHDTSITGEYELLEEDYEEGRSRKGNPQQPSKKEKARMRVRRKL
jgi:uncharacterized protein